MLSMLHESCQVNLFNKHIIIIIILIINKHIMFELKGFGTIINKDSSDGNGINIANPNP